MRIMRLPDTRQAWDRYGLEQIWLMVRDEDGNDSYAQVAAWYRMGRLCTDQADQLQKALDQLMVKWPPNPGSAAESFKHTVEAFHPVLARLRGRGPGQRGTAHRDHESAQRREGRHRAAPAEAHRQRKGRARMERSSHGSVRTATSVAGRDRVARRPRPPGPRHHARHRHRHRQGSNPVPLPAPLLDGPAMVDPHIPFDPNDHERQVRQAVQAPVFDPPEPLPVADAPDHWLPAIGWIPPAFLAMGWIP